MKRHRKSGWIGVDLDGTLAYYEGWDGTHQIGEPIEPMAERVRKWLASGREVKIFTARVSMREEPELSEVREAIEVWTEKHFGQRLEVTCCKDFKMIELWDDRCVRVELNTGKILSS